MFFVQFFHDGGGSEENKSFLQVVFLSRFLSRLNDLNLEDFPYEGKLLIIHSRLFSFDKFQRVEINLMFAAVIIPFSSSSLK